MRCPSSLGLASVLCASLFCGNHVHAQPDKIPTLVSQLEHKSKAVRLHALRELGKLGTVAKGAVDAIGKHLHNADDADEIAQATSTLAQIGPAGVPPLVRALKDGRALHPRHAAFALSKMGPAAKTALPDLIAALKDIDPVVRAGSAKALGEIGPLADETVRALFLLVNDPVVEVRQQAGLSLVRAGPKMAPKLTELLRGTESATRLNALDLLSLLGPDADGALSDLLVLLDDPQPELRVAAAKVLGNLKGRAKEAIPSLARTLANEKEVLVQEEILHALTRIGEHDVPGFLDDMRRINREGNWAAPFALARFGPRGKDAVRPLIKTLKDPDAGMRSGAVIALGQVGPDAFEAIPHLQLLLKDPQAQVRGAAAQALGKIDPRQEAFVEKHFLIALDQGGKALDGVQPQLAKIKARFNAPKLDLSYGALLDPRVQEPLRQLMDFHLFVNAAATQSRRAKDGMKDQLDLLMRQTGKMVDSMGPEGIPVLVYGINQASTFRLGFC